MNDLGRREVRAVRRARAVFQDLCNNLVDSRGFTHQKLNAGDSKEHYTQPNLESIPTEVNGNDFGPPTLLGAHRIECLREQPKAYANGLRPERHSHDRSPGLWAVRGCIRHGLIRSC